MTTRQPKSPALNTNRQKSVPLPDAAGEEQMPTTIISLGDFSTAATEDSQTDSSLAQWATRWNSGVLARVDNPFKIIIPEDQS